MDSTVIVLSFRYLGSVSINNLQNIGVSQKERLFIKCSLITHLNKTMAQMMQKIKYFYNIPKVKM